MPWRTPSTVKIHNRHQLKALLADRENRIWHQTDFYTKPSAIHLEQIRREHPECVWCVRRSSSVSFTDAEVFLYIVDYSINSWVLRSRFQMTQLSFFPVRTSVKCAHELDFILHGWGRETSVTHGGPDVKTKQGSNLQSHTHTHTRLSPSTFRPFVSSSPVAPSHWTFVICGAISLSVSGSFQFVKDIFIWGRPSLRNVVSFNKG